MWQSGVLAPGPGRYTVLNPTHQGQHSNETLPKTKINYLHGFYVQTGKRTQTMNTYMRHQYISKLWMGLKVGTMYFYLYTMKYIDIFAYNVQAFLKNGCISLDI